MPETIQQENKMGVMPVPKLLITMSLPMVLSMLVQALYNIVDSVFVAKISEDALTAVSLAFPIQNLMIAVAVGTGVGINAMLSRYLGEHRLDEANAVTRNGIFISLLTSLIFMAAGVASAGFFFRSQTENPAIIRYGTQYMTVITLFSVGIFMQITFERLMQSTGKTFYNMITQGLGAILNIILDPILIFGLFGLPRMEVMGAAVATVTGQMVAVLLSLYLNCTRNKEISLDMRHFRPCKKTIGDIYKIGIPSIIMQSIGSVMTFGMNKILLPFSSTAAAVFGVYFKLQSFIFMPVFGITNALIPIIAYNYGARKPKRITASYRLSLFICIGIMVLGLLLFQAVPAGLLKLFDASSHMLSIGVPALRLISLSFVFAGYGIVASAIFQALGNGVYSLIVSACRQLILILPMAYLLAKVSGLNAVWWSFPIAEIGSVIISVLLLRRIFRLKVHPLEGDV